MQRRDSRRIPGRDGPLREGVSRRRSPVRGRPEFVREMESKPPSDANRCDPGRRRFHPPPQRSDPRGGGGPRSSSSDPLPVRPGRTDGGPPTRRSSFRVDRRNGSGGNSRGRRPRCEGDDRRPRSDSRRGSRPRGDPSRPPSDRRPLPRRDRRDDERAEIPGRSRRRPLSPRRRSRSGGADEVNAILDRMKALPDRDRPPARRRSSAAPDSRGRDRVEFILDKMRDLRSRSSGGGSDAALASGAASSSSPEPRPSGVLVAPSVASIGGRIDADGGASFGDARRTRSRERREGGSPSPEEEEEAAANRPPPPPRKEGSTSRFRESKFDRPSGSGGSSGSSRGFERAVASVRRARGGRGRDDDGSESIGAEAGAGRGSLARSESVGGERRPFGRSSSLPTEGEAPPPPPQPSYTRLSSAPPLGVGLSPPPPAPSFSRLSSAPPLGVGLSPPPPAPRRGSGARAFSFPAPPVASSKSRSVSDQWKSSSRSASLLYPAPPPPPPPKRGPRADSGGKERLNRSMNDVTEGNGKCSGLNRSMIDVTESNGKCAGLNRSMNDISSSNGRPQPPPRAEASVPMDRPYEAPPKEPSCHAADRRPEFRGERQGPIPSGSGGIGPNPRPGFGRRSSPPLAPAPESSPVPTCGPSPTTVAIDISEIETKGGRNSRAARPSRVENKCHTDQHGDSGLYTGEVNEDGLPHGKGKMKYDNGVSYEGKWVDGAQESNIQRHRMLGGFTSWKGQPKNKDKKGGKGGCTVYGMDWIDFGGMAGKYTGDVNEDSVPDGKGVMKYDFGLIAEGEWVKGVLNGGSRNGEMAGGATIVPGGTVVPGAGGTVVGGGFPGGMSAVGGAANTVVSGLGMMSVCGGAQGNGNMMFGRPMMMQNTMMSQFGGMGGGGMMNGNVAMQYPYGMPPGYSCR